MWKFLNFSAKYVLQIFGAGDAFVTSFATLIADASAVCLSTVSGLLTITRELEATFDQCSQPDSTVDLSHFYTGSFQQFGRFLLADMYNSQNLLSPVLFQN